MAVYFVSDFYQSLASSWEEQSGNHFVTDSSPKMALFAESYKDFAVNVAQSWEFAREMLLPHHSIAIADPYLFKEKTLDSLATLMKTVTPEKLKGKYSVMLIGVTISVASVTILPFSQSRLSKRFGRCSIVPPSNIHWSITSTTTKTSTTGTSSRTIPVYARAMELIL